MYSGYQKLNAKTIPDRHPLPRIQNILNNLGENQYFTLLDQSKAEPLILAYPDFDLPFIFHTDPSGAGLRCGLFQIQDGSIRVIGYSSRTLTGSEEKYHSSKLEFHALNWVICDHFKNYLFYSQHFEVYPDFNPLTYIKTSCEANAIHKIIASVNKVSCVMLEIMKLVLDAAVNQQDNDESWISTVNVLSTSYNDIQDEILYEGGDTSVCSFTRDNIRKAQD